MGNELHKVIFRKHSLHLCTDIEGTFLSCFHTHKDSLLYSESGVVFPCALIYVELSTRIF